MTDPAAPFDGPQIAFESFGVAMALATNDDTLWPALERCVPPHATACGADAVQHRFLVRLAENGMYDVRYDIREGKPAGEMDPLSWIASTVERRFALAMADAYVHNTVALHAPAHVFIQGGVVADGSSAVVLPGKPLTGRTTLVEALVAAGLTYVSDEYAVVDARGTVSRYARPLPSGAGADAEVDDPLPVGAIVLTGYRPGAVWQPERRSSGQTLLGLMAHAIGGQERPEQTMQALKAIVEAGPVVFESPRDEAQATADLLVAELQGARSS
jgi:hypothetical protein